MSRTRHHKGCRDRHIGEDFGAKYNCNKLYCAGTGKVPKGLAKSERRNTGKRIVLDEIWRNYDE